jgi:uncharacterized protein YecE (DUF72 family)
LRPVIFQLSNKFSLKKKESLYHLLQTLTKHIQLFLELRNPEWFKGKEYENIRKFSQMGLNPAINDAPEKILHIGGDLAMSTPHIA